jgi:hypothetical protein
MGIPGFPLSSYLEKILVWEFHHSTTQVLLETSRVEEKIDNENSLAIKKRCKYLGMCLGDEGKRPSRSRMHKTLRNIVDYF